MAFTAQQNGFSAGELSPSLFGRTDLQKYKLGASTMRNFFCNYRGGASSRAGLAYAGKCLQPATNENPPRIIPFQFSISQGYPLEFGDGIIQRAVSNATNNGSGLVRLNVGSTANLFEGAEVTVSGIIGTTEANGTWIISIASASSIDLVGSTFANAYVSGGVCVTEHYMRILQNGAYVTETAKVINGVTNANPAVFSTTTAHGYNVGDWVFPQNIGGMTNFNGLTWIVNTVPSSTQFSVTDLFGNVISSVSFGVYTSGGTVSKVYTIAAPYASVDLPFLKFTQSADTMTLCCVNQLTDFEYPSYQLERFGATDWRFTQDAFDATIDAPVDPEAVAQSSTTLSTWYSYVVTAVDEANGSESNASESVDIQNNDINIYAGSNSLSWQPVEGANSYNIYKATPSYNVPVGVGALYGFVGRSTGITFTDTNIVPDFSFVPPVHDDPFARGQIIDVPITAGGVGYTKDNISYAITTSTGSGFIGIPIIIDSVLSGFVIQNGGKNYEDTDTITISGGGSAVGYIDFDYWCNIQSTNTITLNGVTWTFVTAPLSAVNASVATGDLSGTLTGLVSNLNQSKTASISVASYSLQSTASGYRLLIIYKTSGIAGNAYTIATNITSGGATRSGATLTGGVASGGATATLTIGPVSGTYPSCPAYFQQRRVYANSLNEPDTYWMSQPGAFSNMDSSIPVTDSDAITGSPWSQQINGIQFMQPMPTGLVILTGKGAWLLNGGNNAAITAADQNATAQAFNGCHFVVPPIVVNYDILYVQSKGSIVRDLSYNFFVNVYTGADITVLSSHLFENHQIREWMYAEEPYKVIWAVRNDGKLLSFTYLKEQDVYGWSRHDTNGLFQSTCSVTEPTGDNYIDAGYYIVKRYIVGEDQWAYYAERADDRQWFNAEDCFCVDAGLSYPMTYPNATLTASAADGTYSITSTNLVTGGSGYTAPTATAVDPTGEGSGATFSVTVLAGVITAVTVLTAGQDYAFGTQIVIADTTGSGAVVYPLITNYVTFSASASVFTSGNVGDVIRMGGGKATITTYNSGTEVIADMTQPITEILQNNPEEMPVPAVANSWSLSTPTTVVSGLNHLEGMTVSVLADGNAVLDLVVENGSITLLNEASDITIGLPFIAQLQTMYLDTQDPNGGSVQGRRKNIPNMVVRVSDTRGITAGVNQPDASTQPEGATVPWVGMKSVFNRSIEVEPGETEPLFTGDGFVEVMGGWDTKGQIAIEQTNPLPANILAVFPNFSQGDFNGP